MIYFTGCNAVSTKNIANKISKKDRNEKGEQYFYYYNSMWNFLGDNNDINRTFYHFSFSYNFIKQKHGKRHIFKTIK